MIIGNKIYALVFFAVFLLILIIGVLSEVSPVIGLVRAFLAAAFFTGLCWIAGKTVFKYALPGNRGQEKQKNSRNKPVQNNSANNSLEEEFVPLRARQIDPQASKIIASDPEKMAEIVRKMGLDE